MIAGRAQMGRAHEFSGFSAGTGSSRDAAALFRLPLVNYASGESPQSGDASGKRAGAERRRATETIMVVEDEPDILKICQLMLQAQGYRVLVAPSSEDALRLAGEHGGTIDLLLTDVLMPGMKGTELSKRMTGLFPDIRVLFMSGYAAKNFENEGLTDGRHFIHKPFSLKALAEKIRNLLETT